MTFTSDGSPVEFSVKAGDGSAAVRIDDVRVVPFTPPADAAATPQTVLFEDFEHVDTGYWPFVTGEGNSGGDARTQLAERHEPCSQSGWYGVDSSGKAVAGGKLTDNVLSGQWSLMANEENKGLILQTTQAPMPLVPGHRYRESFDHQTAFADTYSVVVGTDEAGSPVTSTEAETLPLPQARETERFSHKFVASADADATWVGIRKTGGGRQANLTIDDLRLEDLDAAAEQPSRFSDAKPSDMFYDEIMWLANEGITTGWPDGTYRPLTPVNRDAMAAYLYRMAGSPEVTAPRAQPFTDVKPGQEHYDAIIWAYQQGIVKGYADDTSRPTEPINRDAMAAFLYRYAGSPDVTVDPAGPFTDVPADSQFAKEITWLKNEGLTTGWPDGTYRPLTTTNRDAMAAFLYRMSEQKNIAFRSEG